jgi:hypothetical protein
MGMAAVLLSAHAFLLVSCGEAAATVGTSYLHGDGVPANTVAIERWATAIVEGSYMPGPEASSFTDPSQATGPATGVSTSVTVLGRGGSITMDMLTPMPNGDGADFAVWENGIADATNGTLFAELAFVEVSSDGNVFARFPSRTTRTISVDAYEFINPGDYAGFAGLHPAGTGTAFDLDELQAAPEVQAGAVDLTAIRFIRIVDVVGDGATSDSLGNPVYDPYPTTNTAGFDLDGVAVLRAP